MKNLENQSVLDCCVNHVIECALLILLPTVSVMANTTYVCTVYFHNVALIIVVLLIILIVAPLLFAMNLIANFKASGMNNVYVPKWYTLQPPDRLIQDLNIMSVFSLRSMFFLLPRVLVNSMVWLPFLLEPVHRYDPQHFC